MVEDQVSHIDTATGEFFHKKLMEMVVMIAFSILGVLSGILCAVVGTPVAIVYQGFKMAWIFTKAIFSCWFGQKHDQVEPEL